MLKEGLEVVLQPVIVVVLNILAEGFYQRFPGNILGDFYPLKLTVQEFPHHISIKHVLPSFLGAYKVFLVLAIELVEHFPLFLLEHMHVFLVYSSRAPYAP